MAEGRMTNDRETIGGGGLKPGDRIGKYEVRELLGAGGQSIVYKAYDPPLDRFVAIKQIAPHLAVNEAYLAMLRENFRKIARIGQRNDAVVTIHDVLDDPRGMFYVMEFVEGHTLERLLAEAGGPIEPRAVLVILFRLAAVLHDVHAEGIIHRDLKPSNIILMEGLRPRIIDFGMAAFGDPNASMPLATTKYLAPELYSRSDADARADLYSLGFLTYEMLVGRPKFNEIFEEVVRDPHSAALRWMKWHGNESVSAPPPHEVNPAVPRALSDIVMKLIRKNPDQRFADAEELGRAIKENFSPRYRSAAGILPHAGERVGPPASQPAEEMRKEGDRRLPPADGGGGGPADATLDLDGPDTVPLPRPPMSRRRKAALLVLVGVMVLAVLGGGVAWLLRMRLAGRQQALSAAQQFEEGMSLYNQGRYASALEKFQRLGEEHSGTLRAAKADVLAAMCRAQLAIEQRRWSDAQLEEDRALRAAEAIQERAEDKALDEWARDMRRQIEQIGRSRLSANIYHDALEQARSRLERANRAVDFDEILRDFQRQLGASGVGLTPRQETEAEEMQRFISRRKFLFLFEQHLQEGDALLGRREYDAADAAYLRAHDMLRDEETALQMISPEQRDSLLEKARARRKELADRRREDRAMQAIRSAEAAKDISALQKALREALSLSTLSRADRNAYEARLRGLEADQAVAAAEALGKERQYEKALALLEKAQTLQPDHLGARTLRVNLERARDRRDAEQAGDRAAERKQWDEALRQYRRAESLEADEAIRNKLRNVEYQKQMEKADALAKEEKYDEAEAAYAEARRIQPAAAAHVEAMVLLMRERREYGRCLAQGDEALRQRRWQEAIRWFLQAKQKTRDPREVDARISETYYQKFLAGGKKALEEENLPVARWNFKQALRYKDTPEARQLLRQAGGEEEKE